MNKVCISALALLALCSCKSNVWRQPVRQKDPVKVETVTLAASSSLSRHSYMGEVVPAKSVTLLSPYPGTVESISVCKGDVVEKGAVAAVIASQAAESSFRIAEANLQQARDGYERVSKVYATGSVTEIQMVEAGTLLTKAEASMEAARKAKDDCSLKAPYRGVVSEVFPVVGEEVLPAQRMLTIIDLSELKIRISVHENEINAITKGAEAFFDVPALGLYALRARVREKNVLSSLLTHSYACSLVPEKKISSLMPGMLVKVYFENTGDSSIVVPAPAVQLDSEGKYVWMVREGIVEKRRIEVGGYAGEGVIVSDGLSEGEKVIVKGYQKVSGGMKVTSME